MKRLISVLDAKDYVHEIFRIADEIKNGKEYRLDGKVIGLIFEKPSTRTRISFEVAIHKLNSYPLIIDTKLTQLSRGEPIKDFARVLKYYVDAIVYRGKHETLIEIYKYFNKPVINALSEIEHPCQALTDIYTIKEFVEDFRKYKLAYIGDGNNVCNSLILASSIVGLNIYVATPKGYEPDKYIVNEAKKISEKTGARIVITNDVIEAVKDADFVYTDTWISMHQEHEREKRLRDFSGYQINTEILKYTNNAKVMHCLPAYRGYEITEDVMESENSIIFKQVENRLYVEEAILYIMLR